MDATLEFYKSSSPLTVKHRVKFGNSTGNYINSVDVPLVTGTVQSVVVPNLDPTLPWYFKVFAVNSFNTESTGSNEVDTDDAPAAPSLLSIKKLV